MDRKQDLRLNLIEAFGTGNIYFQPPENVKMNYPCVVCNFEGIHTLRADNRNYIKTNRYDITYISRKESANIVDSILDYFSYITMNRQFKTNGLHHYNFTLYY